MASKSKRPAGYNLNAADRRRGMAVQVGLIAVVVIFAVGLLGYIVMSNNKKHAGVGSGAAVQLSSSKLVTRDGSNEPKATVSFYEDFLCPACGNFERMFGPTVRKLIDIGAIEADYHMVAILSRPQNDDYSSRAAAAAYCVADEDKDAFWRFHTALFSTDIQPSEIGTDFPDNKRLIELAREAGAAGGVPACINSGKYIKMVDGMAKDTNIHATPTIRINGDDYTPSTPEALVSKIREIVGDVPGLDSVIPPKKAS